MVIRTTLFVFFTWMLGMTFVIGGGQSITYFFDAKTLYDRCRSVRTVDREACSAYIAGVHDALSATRDVQHDAKIMAKCNNGQSYQLKQARTALIKEMEQLEGLRRSGIPASRSVLAIIPYTVCEDEDAILKSIRKKLGKQPPRGTPEWVWHRKTLMCMTFLEKSLEECFDMLKKGTL